MRVARKNGVIQNSDEERIATNPSGIMLATMEAGPTKAYNQNDPSSVATPWRVDATGFIRLNALRLKVAAKVRRKK